jgi:hypothetical protein
VVAVSRVMFGGRMFSKGDVIEQPNFGSFNSLVRSGALVPLPHGIDSESSAGEEMDAGSAGSAMWLGKN